MFQNHNKILYIWCLIILIFGSYALSSDATEEVTVLRGHVLAVIDSWFPAVGMSDRFQQFVFGVETKDQLGNKVISPVLVNYLIPRSEDSLPKLFLKYSNLLELQVSRFPYDKGLESVALIKHLTADNKEASPPELIMKLVDGAPTDILKMDMVLPYYDLVPGGYKRIDSIGGGSSKAAE